MFLDFLNKKDTLGISFGDKRVTMVQVANSKEIVALNSIELVEGLIRGGRIVNTQQLSYRIKDCLEKSAVGKFSKKTEDLNLYANLPEQFHFVQVVDLPEKFSSEELTKYAEEKFYESVPMGDLSCYVNYVIEGKKLFISGIVKDIYDSYYKFLQDLGFKKISIIPKSFALAKALLDKQLLAPKIVAQINGEKSLLFVFTANRNLALSISVLSGINYLQVVCDGINETIKYFELNIGGKIDSIILTGEAALLSDTSMKIEQLTGVKCAIGNVEGKVKGLELMKKVDSPILYTTALGLALLP
jgi:Tfp pilus assembly PilM family ATPase